MARPRGWRRDATSRLRSAVGAEVVVILVVLGLTALLVNARPAKQAYAAPFSTEVKAGPTLVNVVVDPAKAGPLAVHLFILTSAGIIDDVPEVDATMSDTGSGINGLKLQLNTADLELASGRSINSPSDNPSGIAALVLNHAAQSSTDTFQRNIGNLQSTLQIADSALNSAVGVINQAISLGVQAGNSSLSSGDRQAITQQLLGIQQQLLSIANTKSGGTYLVGAYAHVGSSTSPQPVRWVGAFSKASGSWLYTSIGGPGLYVPPGAPSTGPAAISLTLDPLLPPAK